MGNQIKNLHLIISVLIVVPVAFVYGFLPNFISQSLFDVEVATLDLANIFKAVMGFYLASASLWVLGLVKSKYWEIATISNIVFMFGLSTGRFISLIYDGIPSAVFLYGTFAELILAIFGIYQLMKFRKSV